jgi:hypothetical protein
MPIIQISDLSAEEILEAMRGDIYVEHNPNASLSSRFADIKRAWAHHLPRMEKDYQEKDCLRYDPYFYDWIPLFSPIESNVWSDIRYHGAPLYPQFPTNGFFLDFANPMRKIAVECDGASYHNYDKDMLRDRKLIDDGWLIFRVTGRECNNYMDDVFCREPDDNESEHKAQLWKWFMNTSEGLIYSINEILFPREKEPRKYHDICIESLVAHQSDQHGEIDYDELRRQYAEWSGN